MMQFIEKFQEHSPNGNDHSTKNKEEMQKYEVER